MRIRFGPFEFDRQNLLLWRDGADIALPPRVLGVLELLTERPGQVVARQELLDRVWKDAFVTDTSLAEAVSFLRQALGDDPQSPRYIQTVHRRGYRFVAPLRGASSAPAGAAPGGGLAPGRQPGDVKPSIVWQLLPWSLAILCAATALAALWHFARVPADTPPVARFELQPAPGTWFDRRAPGLAVSNDGRSIAWSGCDRATGGCALFVRRIDQLDPSRLPGTDGAEAPFFSPDGRWLGFFADGKLKKISLSGGAPIPLADAPFTGGASWGPNGTIVFCGAPAGGLSLASDQGGDVSGLTTPRYSAGELRHEWPAWLDDQRAILFTVITSPAPGAPGQVAVMPANAHAWRVLRTGIGRGSPAGPGYLVLASGPDLQAVTFDEQTLSLTGASDSVFEAVGTAGGVAQFATGGGTLVALRAPTGPRTFQWEDAPGHPVTGLARLSQIAIAPDGRRAAGVAADVSGSDVWTVDLISGAEARATFSGANAAPAWSADGTGLLFASRSRSGPFQIANAAGGTGRVEPVGPGAIDGDWFPSSAARDGRIAAIHTSGGGHLAASVISGDTAQPLGGGPFDDTAAVFSPDGRWIAIESNESGRRDIYVRSAADPRRIPVSTTGGERPSWSADGRAIYYHEGRRLLRATFDPATASISAREVAFDRPDAEVVAVTSEGRLLVAQGPLSPDSAIVTLEWLRELRQRLLPPVVAPK